MSGTAIMGILSKSYQYLEVKDMNQATLQTIFSQAYQPFYITFLLVCLVIALEIFGRIQRNIGRTEENRAFRRIIITYIVYILDDLLWIITYTNPKLFVLSKILEYIETGILTIFTFSWFQFAEYYIDGFPVKNGCIRRIFYIPLIIACSNSLFFCMNVAGLAGNTVIPSQYLYGVNSSADFFYMIFAFVHTLVSLKREERKTRKQRYRVILECIIYPAIGAFVSLYIFYVPFIIMGILPSTIKILIEMQNAHIYTDALTGINNRYRVNEYLEKEWGNISEAKPIYMYLIDINKFKRINDQFGHVVGDRALVAVADTLKKVASEGIIIGRFGGDEFILVDALNHDPEQVKRDLRESLKEHAEKEEFPFSLTISIGYAKCTNPAKSITEVVALADAELYEDKARAKIKHLM